MYKKINLFMFPYEPIKEMCIRGEIIIMNIENRFNY